MTMVSKKQGFTLLYASLVSALLLAVGLAVFAITQKQFLLSSTERESQIAFFAADSGIECALFHDFDPNGTAFATSSPSQFTCNGMMFTGGGNGYGNPSTFQITFPPSAYCVDVSVTKFDAPVRTVVEARGYNTCDVSNPRRVERALRATY